MSTPTPELPELLPGFAERLEARAEEVAASHRTPTSADPHPTRHRRRWRLFGGGTLVAVVAVSGAYATGLWRPQLGSNPDDAPTASARAVAPELLDRFAVLRRPQTDADRGAAATTALRFPATSRAGIQTAAVRTVPLRAGGSAVLIPIIDEVAGTQELCLVVLAAPKASGRACATADQVAAGALVITAEAPASAAAEADRAARRRDAQQGDAAGRGGVQQDPSAAGGATRVTGVAPDGVRALWIGDVGPVEPADNVFDVTAESVPTDPRARWDN